MCRSGPVHVGYCLSCLYIPRNAITLYQTNYFFISAFFWKVKAHMSSLRHIPRALLVKLLEIMMLRAKHNLKTSFFIIWKFLNRTYMLCYIISIYKYANFLNYNHTLILKYDKIFTRMMIFSALPLALNPKKLLYQKIYGCMENVDCSEKRLLPIDIDRF